MARKTRAGQQPDMDSDDNEDEVEVEAEGGNEVVDASNPATGVASQCQSLKITHVCRCDQ